MKKYIFLLLFPTSLYGQTVTIPQEVKGMTGRLLAVQVDYDGDDIKWTGSPELDIFREYDPDPKKVKLRVIAYKDGLYQIKAITCKDKKLSEFGVCTLIIGKDPTPPPPPPPDPTDPLVTVLQAAYDKETDTNKAELKTKLAALYRQAIDTVMKPEITTWGQLFTVMKAAATTLGISGKLPILQAAIAQQMNLPTDGSKQLGFTGMQQATEAFTKVSKALDKVK